MSDVRHQLYMWLIGDRLTYWRWRRALRRAKRTGTPVPPLRFKG